MQRPGPRLQAVDPPQPCRRQTFAPPAEGAPCLPRDSSGDLQDKELISPCERLAASPGRKEGETQGRMRETGGETLTQGPGRRSRSETAGSKTGSW